ncbi:MAG TPA: segregation/condensation protein A [Spirochaetota bacterium]|nr:segregation/condensation protein A [Spirochaetota bacterium]
MENTENQEIDQAVVADAPEGEVEVDDNKYVLRIENFEGPLDLLWNLIKRSKIDIVEVSISAITEQYIAYLKEMEKMSISIATEFINMASELLYYKSKALLPSGELDDDFFVPPLPPELVAKLLEYKKYQLSSMKLRELYDRQADCYFREVIPPVPEGEEEFVTMSLFDLLNAFVDIMSKGTAVEEKEIVLDEILVSDRINFLIALLKTKESIVFQELFPKVPTRAEVIATFLAVLELTKLHKIRVMQERTYGTIHINRAFDPSEDIGHLESEFREIQQLEENPPQ